LKKANLHAYDTDRVATQACWAGQSDKAAMRLWSASGNDTLEEYLWVDRSNDENGTTNENWVWQQSWTGYDIHAGIGCHNGGPVYSGGHDLPIFVILTSSQFELGIWTMSTADAATQFDQLNSSSAWINGKYTLVTCALDRLYG
jgi:hypothetical protein